MTAWPIRCALPFALVLFALFTLGGCGSDEEASDNRPSVTLKIINTSGSTCTVDFTAQNENYEFQFGADRYPTHTLTLTPGSTTTCTAYAMDRDSHFCEILLHLDDDTKGVVFYADYGEHSYTIRPGLLGASGPG